MRVEVKVIKESDNDVERQGASIETHTRRGDAFNVHSARTVVEGDSQVFVMPPGGRLVINTPTAQEQPVYDRDQAAAVYMSQQSQGREVGDRANPDDVVKARQRDLDLAKEAAARQKEQDQRQQEALQKATQTPPQGTSPQVQSMQPNSAPVGSNESPNSKSSQSSPMPDGATGGGTPNKPAGQTGVTQSPSGNTLKTTSTPNTTPAHGGAPQGGNTEKK